MSEKEIRATELIDKMWAQGPQSFESYIESLEALTAENNVPMGYWCVQLVAAEDGELASQGEWYEVFKSQWFRECQKYGQLIPADQKYRIKWMPVQAFVYNAGGKAGG